MKKDYLINFKLFCNRRGFSLEQWLRSSKENSYENLSTMLVDLKVCPPLKDEYDAVKNKIETEFLKKEVVNPAKRSSKISRKKKKNEKDSV
jgi:hypothetical protein|tara:strand:+ start:270 stop:542 length:273 start_codon:yes stop_codon:yes gene_type:complete